MNRYEEYEKRKKLLQQQAVNGKGWKWLEQETIKLAKELGI
jgi:hypothetical protein